MTPLVVLTQAAEGSDSLASQLSAAGLEVQRWPLVRLEPVAAPVIAPVLQRLAGFDWVLLFSPSAVRLVSRRMEDLGLSWPAGVRAGLVGPASVEAFRDCFGDAPVVDTPAAPPHDADHLVETIVATRADRRPAPDSARVLVLNRPDGRTHWLERLRQQVQAVEVVAAYRAEPLTAGPAPDLSRRLERRRREGGVVHWVIGAGSQVDTLVQALPPEWTGWATRQPVLVPHPAVLAHAQRAGFENAQVYDDRRDLVQRLQYPGNTHHRAPADPADSDADNEEVSVLSLDQQKDSAMVGPGPADDQGTLPRAADRGSAADAIPSAPVPAAAPPVAVTAAAVPAAAASRAAEAPAAAGASRAAEVPAAAVPPRAVGAPSAAAVPTTAAAPAAVATAAATPATAAAARSAKDAPSLGKIGSTAAAASAQSAASPAPTGQAPAAARRAMSEPPDPPPSPPFPPTSPPPRAAGRRGGAAWALLLLLLVGLLAAGGWWYTQQRFLAAERESAARVKEAEARAARLEEQIRSLRDAQGQLQSRSSSLEARIAQSASQQEQLAGLYEEIAKARGEGALAEVEQSVTMANQHLELTGNVQGALLALQNAERRLSETEQPQAAAARRLVLQDIERLKALPEVDLGRLAGRLDEIINRVDRLPLLADAQQAVAAPAPSPAPPGEAPPAGGSAAATPAAAPAPSSEGTPAATAVPPDEEPSRWQRIYARVVEGGARSLDMVKEEFRSLVTIRRIDKPDSLLLSPEQKEAARQNLKLMLLNARLNLLNRHEELFRQDLARAIEAVQRLFDVDQADVKTAVATLESLQSQPLALNLPSLGESLGAVRAARAAGEKRS